VAKTTLLNALCGRAAYGAVQGQVRTNNLAVQGQVRTNNLAVRRCRGELGVQESAHGLV
jgi:hypothetical protein